MNKRHYEHTLPNIRGSLSNTYFYPKVAKCSNVDCSVTIFRNKSEKQLTDKQITELVTTGKTGLIKGFKSKNGKVFDASLAFDGQFNVTFVFPEKKGKPQK